VAGLLLNADTLHTIRHVPLTNVRTGWQMVPQLTYNQKDQVYMGAWFDSPDYEGGGFGDIQGQMVQAENGFLVGSTFLIMESPDEGIFSEMPGLAYSEIEDRYLVLGAYGGAPNLQGQYVLPNRSLDGQPFPLDSTAIQNAVIARKGEGTVLPAWLAVWTHQGDIHGKALSGEPVGDLDTDQDGLPDAEERAGYLNQFGEVITTNPLEVDTDADGIPDGEEIGTKSGNVYYMLSDPTLDDTDNDGVEDFVELYALPYPTEPRDKDTDGDGLSDGDEVNIYSTDPLVMDTDGDKINDGDEISEDSDPLLFAEKMTPGETFGQFFVGLVGGDFYIDNPKYGTIPFLVGLLISGGISLIPAGVTQVIGLLADGRDLVAALIRGDALSITVLAISLIPYIGDPADFIGTIVRFVGRYPKLAGEVAIVVVRLDFIWKYLDDADQLKILKHVLSDEVIETLLNRGFEFSRIMDLANAGVDLRHVSTALGTLVDQFPGLIDFLNTVPIKGQGILKGGGLTADLKKLANAQRIGNVKGVTGALSNIKGAYTQVVMKSDLVKEGIEVIQDLRHVNGPGYDLVLKEGVLYRLLEAKSSANLVPTDFKNYFRMKDGQAWLNTTYLKKWLGEDTAKLLMETENMVVEIFINNPRSAEIKAELLSKLGGDIIKYLDDNLAERTIKLVITAVSK
jgi:hypothetical protein